MPTKQYYLSCILQLEVRSTELNTHLQNEATLCTQFKCNLFVQDVQQVAAGELHRAPLRMDIKEANYALTCNTETEKYMPPF